MTEPSEPLWELLPHAPERFFGLSGDFDLRDLKRSYNRMIRQFKPEKFPEEFQRIRGAYESLSDALRYNVPARPPVEPPAPPDRDGAQTQEARPSRNSHSSPASHRPRAAVPAHRFDAAGRVIRRPAIAPRQNARRLRCPRRAFRSGGGARPGSAGRPIVR